MYIPALPTYPYFFFKTYKGIYLQTKDHPENDVHH